MCVPHGLHPLVCLWHLGHFHVLAVVNNAARNTGVWCRFGSVFSFSSDKCAEWNRRTLGWLRFQPCEESANRRPCGRTSSRSRPQGTSSSPARAVCGFVAPKFPRPLNPSFSHSCRSLGGEGRLSTVQGPGRGERGARRVPRHRPFEPGLLSRRIVGLDGSQEF